MKGQMGIFIALTITNYVLTKSSVKPKNYLVKLFLIPIHFLDTCFMSSTQIIPGIE